MRMNLRCGERRKWKSFLIIFLGVMLLVESKAAVQQEMRVWRSRQGTEITARCLAVEAGHQVVLQDATGRELRVPSASLSLEDQGFLWESGIAPTLPPVRNWTAQGGQQLFARLIGVTDGKADLDAGTRRVSIALTQLSAQDQELAQTWNQQEQARRKETLLKLPFGTIQPGTYQEFDVPIPEGVTAAVDRTKFSGTRTMRVGIATPASFDPSRPWPVFRVYLTGSGDVRQMGVTRSFHQAAIQSGWVVIGIGSATKEHELDTPLSWVLQEALMVALEPHWPEVRRWPVALGGFSGGAKYASWMAVGFAAGGYHVAGMYLTGINQEYASSHVAKYDPPKEFVKQVRIVIGNGNKDSIAPRASTDRVESGLRGGGYEQLLMAGFEGGHQLHQKNIQDGLKWISESLAGVGPTPTAAPVEDPQQALLRRMREARDQRAKPAERKGTPFEKVLDAMLK